MTVRQLLTNADSRELTEWGCFLNLEAERIDEKRKEPERQKQQDLEAKLKHAFGTASASTRAKKGKR